MYLFRSSALAAAAVVLALTGLAAAALSPTRVSTYHPAGLRGPTLHGSCWTDSNATARRDAYRCMVGNDIYDPCFTAGAHLVGCPNDVASNRGVYIVIPSFPSNPSGTPAPWSMELSNAAQCTVVTGTGIQGYPFGCTDSLMCSWPRRGSPRYTATCGRQTNDRVPSPRVYHVIQIWM